MAKPQINWRLMKIVSGKTIGILADLDVPIGSCQPIPAREHPAGIETLPTPGPQPQAGHVPAPNERATPKTKRARTEKLARN